MAGRWLFRDLTFSLIPGQVLAIRGANGSGKSTLLRVLAGLLEPDQGVVEWPGPDRRRSVGYAALDMALYSQLTAREHLELGRSLRGGADALLLLEETGLPPDQEVGTFSSGMRARLKFLLAIQHAPAVLLVDEPSAALDETGREWIDATFKRLQSSTTIVLATNDPRDLACATHEVMLGG